MKQAADLLTTLQAALEEMTERAKDAEDCPSLLCPFEKRAEAAEARCVELSETLEQLRQTAIMTGALDRFAEAQVLSPQRSGQTPKANPREQP